MTLPVLSTLELTQLTPAILQIAFNRLAVRNAINSVMMQDLLTCWRYCASDEALRCLILTGKGEAFCAGADLKERQHISLAVWKEQRAILEKAVLAMIACPQPIIAAVNGPAFGGGLELMLACDFAYGAKEAIFSQSEVKLGLMPGALGTQNLPRAAGIRRAKELTFTGDVFTAEQAFQWGILNKVCEQESLLAEVLTVAEKISDNAPRAVRLAKQALTAAQHLDLSSGYTYEISLYQQLLPTKDREEGILAFNEKRKPHFTGN